uniref:Uncharacterized protein n=1 Tax=Romanomermis culicivorax TaxID=13658 RepID=A0A915L8H3_ROMCU
MQQPAAMSATVAVAQALAARAAAVNAAAAAFPTAAAYQSLLAASTQSQMLCSQLPGKSFSPTGKKPGI